jgi:hypothetical protein
MLKLSELVAALSKLQSAVGDIPVKFKELESDAATELKSISLELDASASATNSVATLNHGTPSPEPEPEAASAPTDAAASDQVAAGGAPA